MSTVEVLLVFDSVPDIYFRNNERVRRGNEHLLITGPDHKCPKNMYDVLESI